MQRIWIGMAIAWAWSVPGWAAPYHIEGPSHPKRAEAARQAREASVDGVKTRVVRRYRQGVGWQFLLRVEGFADPDQAREVAAGIAERLGAEVAVIDAEATGAAPLEIVQPPPPPASEEEEVAETRTVSTRREKLRRMEPVDLTDPDAVLRRVAATHGGTTGGLAAIQAAPGVLFTFRRVLPSGLIADHTWARRADAAYLEVRIVEGEGRSSRLLSMGDQAWLAVEGSAMEPTDPERAQETLRRFAPDQQVPFVLTFAHALEDDPTLEVEAPEAEGGHVLLRSAGDRTEGPLQIRVGQQDWTIQEVYFEDDDLRYRFDGWTEEGAVPVPARVRTWRGDVLTDTVEISTLSVNPDLPDAWFTGPSAEDTPGSRSVSPREP